MNRPGYLPTLLILLAAPSLAAAQEHYRLEGEDARGAFVSEVALRAHEGRVLVERRVTWADGQARLYRGDLEPGLELRGTLRDARGASGALRGDPLNYVGWAFRPGARCVERVRYESGAQAQARGERVAAPERETGPKEEKDRSLRGRLLGLAEDEARKLLAKGGEVDVSLGDFGHVAIKGQLDVLTDDRLTPEQREASARGRPGAWVATTLSGGARVGHGASVELGEVALSLGLRTGAGLRYRVVERYPLTPGLSLKERVSELASRARDAYELPLSASEARSLQLGAERSLAGNWEVLFNGSLSVGNGVEGRATLGGSYRLRDDFQLDVRRLSGDAVRLRLVKARKHTLGVRVKALLGLALEDYALEHAPSSLSFVAKEVADEAEDWVRIELSLAASGSRERELQLIYDLDLAQPAAARAYERALRGDFRALEGEGITQVRRSVGVERVRRVEFELGVGKLASFSRSRTTTRSETRIEDAAGTRVERLGQVERGKNHSWFGRDERHRLTLAGLWTIYPSGKRELAVELRYSGRDEHTGEREFERWRGALIAAGATNAAGLERKRKSRMALEVLLNRTGLGRLARAGQEELLQAYAVAIEQVEGRAQVWRNPSQRAKVRRVTRRRTGQGWKRSTHSQRPYLLRAERFAKDMRELQQARTQEAQEEAFLRLARRARWQLYEIGALARLAGQDGRDLSGSLNGASIR